MGCFGLSFEEYCWLVLVWIGFEECLYKGNVRFTKEMLSKICQNPCSCFRYRLIYKNPNEVISIVKEP